jgi:hypothetical protein
MKRIIVLTIALWLVASCGGKKDDSTQGGAQTVEQKKPVQQIPDEGMTQFEKLASAYIRPCFDDQATQTEMTIKAGDPFNFYVFAEYSSEYPMSAAEYRLALPKGVSIASSANCDSTILTLGKPEEDFMMAFRCAPGPKMWLVRYTCTSDPSFGGGTIETQKGVNLDYLGFTMCDTDRTMIRAGSGKAVLKIE